MLAVGLQALKHCTHLFGWLAIDAVQDKLGVAQNGIQRCPKLVAHVGKELGLVPTCDLKLAAFVLNFIKEACILDRNHRLIGKGRNQFDLLIVERPHRPTDEYNDPDWYLMAQERNGKDRP